MDFENIKRAIAADERRERIEKMSDEARAAIADAEAHGFIDAIQATELRMVLEGGPQGERLPLPRWARRPTEGPQHEPLFN